MNEKVIEITISVAVRLIAALLALLLSLASYLFLRSESAAQKFRDEIMMELKDVKQDVVTIKIALKALDIEEKNIKRRVEKIENKKGETGRDAGGLSYLWPKHILKPEDLYEKYKNAFYRFYQSE
jgi:hypothetical protein